MKNIKRILGILLALAMMMVPLSTALAAPQTVDIDGEGEVIVASVVDVDKLRTTLPTDQGFSFVLDPLGIYGMSVEDVEKLVPGTGGRLGTMEPGATPSDPPVWTPLPSAGQIVFTSGYAPFVVNESNYAAAVQIEYEFKVVDGAQVPSPLANTVFAVEAANAVNIAGTPAVPHAVDDCDGDTDPCTGNPATCPLGTPEVPAPPNVFLAATFSTGNVNSEPEAFAGAQSLPITDTAKTPLFVFPTATYANKVQANADQQGNVVSATIFMREVFQPGTGNGTQFMLSGSCSALANWGKLGASGTWELGKDVNVSISIGYTIDKASDDQIDADDISGANGLKETNTLAAAAYTSIPRTYQFAPVYTADEQAAMEATDDAIAAAGDATDALGDLQDAMAAFLLDEDEAALEAAIEAAEVALADAEDALEDVDGAILAAIDADLADESPDIYLALELAKSDLETAIVALETKIDEAKEELKPKYDYTLNPGGSATAIEVDRNNLPARILLVGAPDSITSVMNVTTANPGPIYQADRYEYDSATGIFTLLVVPGTANSRLRITVPGGTVYDIRIP